MSHSPRLCRRFELFLARFAFSDHFVSLSPLWAISFRPAGRFTPGFGEMRYRLNLLNYSSKIPLHH